MQNQLKYSIAALLLSMPVATFADSSYEHTTQITGGQLIDTLKHIPFMGGRVKQMSEPQTEKTVIHGNQKAMIGVNYTEIYDLDKEQIVHIDNLKHTYSVVTFADMRRMAKQLQEKLAENQQKMQQEQEKAHPQSQPSNIKMTFSVDVKETGMTKMIDRYNTKQQIVTMKAIATDTTNPANTATYTFTEDLWTTPETPAEMKEAEEFDKRFARKMMESVDASDILGTLNTMRNAQASMTQMFAQNPEAGEAFLQAGKELAKIKGTRLMEVTRMGGAGTSAQQNGNNANNNQDSNNNSGNTGRFGLPSVGGALAGAFGHKKKDDQQQQAANGKPGETSLMETTTQTHNFSSMPVAPSVFDIPAGYKQVPSEEEQMLNRK